METDLDELERLEKAATPRPWSNADWRQDDGPRPVTVQSRGEPSTSWPGGFEMHMVSDGLDSSFSVEQAIADAAFIAAARNSLPALIAELRVLRKLREAAEANERRVRSILASDSTFTLSREMQAEFDALAACRAGK